MASFTVGAYDELHIHTGVPGADEFLTTTGWDALPPMFTPLGEVYFGDGGAASHDTELLVQNTWYVIDPAVTLVSNNAEFASDLFDSADGRLRYIGAETEDFACSFTLVISTDVNGGHDYHIGIFKSGVLIPGTEQHHDFNGLNHLDTWGANRVVSMDTNDYLELHIRNTDGSGQMITCTHVNMVAVGDKIKIGGS
jgi:hypothetical protein